MDNIHIEVDNEKILLLGDVHWGARSDSSVFHGYMKDFFDDLFQYMNAEGIKYIMQFGDLFDRRKYINFITLQHAQLYMFERLREYGIQMLVLVGNHDIPYKNTIEINSVRLLTEQYNDVITTIDKVSTLYVNGKELALVLPWICQDNQQEANTAIVNSNAPLCFGHLEVAGFQMYKGAVCEHGLDRSMFKRFEHVYSGHFHHISTDGNITYIGSPFQLTWADYGDDRGSFILDTSSLKTNFIKNPYTMFYMIDYDDKDDVLTNEIIEAMDLSHLENRYVKVKIINKDKPLLLERLIERLNEVKSITHTVDLTMRNTTLADGEVIEAEDITDTFKRSVNAFDKNIQNSLYNLLIDLYNEATNLSTV